MLEFHKSSPPLHLCLTVQPLGNDLCLHLFGGTEAQGAQHTSSHGVQGAHVGAVALALPRPSGKDAGRSASVSLLTVPGHQEDLLARQLALLAASRTGVCVVLVCGIHVDKASESVIQQLEQMAQSLVQDMLHHLPPPPTKESPCSV